MRNKRVKLTAWILAAAMFMTAAPAGSVRAEEQTVTSEMAVDVQEEIETQKESVQEEAERSEGQTLEVQAAETQAQEIPAALNYLYINEAEQEVGDEQNIVVSWGDGTEEIRYIKLTLENEKGEMQTTGSIYHADGVFLFSDYFEKGVYHIADLTVVTPSAQKTFSMAELNVSAYFSVGKDSPDEKKSDHIEMESAASEEIETQVVTIDENGVATAQDSVAEALEEAGGGFSRAARATQKEVVVVLDPGHDSKHAGASGNGVKEEVATLKIANYCKTELETYEGVTVYLTRTTAACPFPSSTSNLDDIGKRVEWAASKGASMFVSIHLNSNPSTGANGAEVYYSASSTAGKNLSQKIQNELIKIGLYDRKIKSNDAYKVINTSNKKGIPGIIVEHAFLSNASDASKYLKTEAGLKKLGVADATGIATYLGLSKKATVTELDTTVLTTISQNKGAVTVNWEKVANASGYYVYRKLEGESWTRIAKVTSGSTLSYTDSAAPEGNTYIYTVKAYNGSVYGGYDKNGLSIYTLAKPNVTSAVYNENKITVNWEAVSNAKQYYVYRKVNGGSWKRITIVDENTFTYEDTAISVGNKYGYTVRAFNENNSSSYYVGKEAVTLANTPLVSAKYSAGAVTVKWQKVTGAAGYRVYRKVKGGSWKLISKVTSGSKVSYTDTGIAAGKNYIYTVRAYKGDRIGGYDKNGVAVTTPSKVYLTYKAKSSVNYRTGAGTSYKKAGTLKKNKTVQVVSGYAKTVNGTKWYKVKINSKFYYISSKYLKKV